MCVWSPRAGEVTTLLVSSRSTLAAPRINIGESIIKSIVHSTVQLLSVDNCYGVCLESCIDITRAKLVRTGIANNVVFLFQLVLEPGQPECEVIPAPTSELNGMPRKYQIKSR